MELTLDLPEVLSAVLAVPGQDVSRSVFETIALEGYRERKITTAQLRRLLGFESGYDLDGFLKAARGVARVRVGGAGTGSGEASAALPLSRSARGSQILHPCAT